MTEAFSPEGAQTRRPTRAAEEQAQRRRRSDTSETRNLKLAVPDSLLDKDKFVYRWINNTASGRIHDKTVNDDWDIVQQIGPNKEEVPVVRNVGRGENGQPTQAYLCRKPKAYHEEDKGRALSAIKEREEALRQGVTADPQGLHGPTAYVPGGANANRIGR